MKEIFYELITEAANGQVIIDNEPWPCGFNTKINGQEFFDVRNLSTLVIKNEETFFKLLTEYITLELAYNRKFKVYTDPIRNQIKGIMMYLFVNATPEDFINPEELLKKRISFINDQTFHRYDNETRIKTNQPNIKKLNIKRTVQGLTMETPYKIEIAVSDDNDNISPLADISYGIFKEFNEIVCYIYSIMKPKDKKDINDEEKKYQKKINRYLYKLNDGVYEQESDEFKLYKEGKTDYYPENITDVTHSFVLATTIFISMLEKAGIRIIKVVPYLPLRYLSRSIAATNAATPERQQELIDRNNRIQDNATNKFLRTFRRVQYHMSSMMTIINEPYENDENMIIVLEKKQIALNNPILNDLHDTIMQYEIPQLEGSDIMLPSEELRKAIEETYNINLQQYAWSEEFKQEIMSIQLDPIYEKKAKTLDEIYQLGFNIGHCGLTSRYVAINYSTATLYYGNAKLLVGTEAAPNGEHAWTVINGHLIDTTLMLCIPIEEAINLGYIAEKDIAHDSARMLSEYDVFDNDFRKAEQQGPQFMHKKTN